MFKKISLGVFLALFISSCDPAGSGGNNCPQTIGVSTSAVTGPIEAAVDVAINLEVSYITKKNCGAFVSFFKDLSPSPLTEIITVNASYDVCSCDEVVSTEKQIYVFKKSIPGIYILKFRETNTTFIEHTITVQ
jgi:hypothetical protein